MKFLISFLTYFILLIFSNSAFSQEELKMANYFLEKNGEVHFSFKVNNKSEINEFSNIISIDYFKDNTVWAYANKTDFAEFLKLNIEYAVIDPKSDFEAEPKMMNSFEKATYAWDAYPTYPAYISMMNQFATNYPNLCSVVNIGKTVNNRDMLFLKISDNQNIRENEPRILLLSGIHGNEISGSVNLLRMMEYLLVNYSSNSRIKSLVENIEIWICPFLNPDGTWAGGDHTISSAKRTNGNNIDINRNFPNAIGGQHPDGKVWQPETNHLMNLLDSLTFTMSVNYHCGAEVVNYPFDTWVSNNKTHADDNWWQMVSKMYADTAKSVSNSYMTNVIGSGYINGGNWYVVKGSYQDYANYYAQCRDVTIEVCATKIVSATALPTYWDRNYRSILNYMEEAIYGIQGVVTDSCSGEPLSAKIELISHDRDSSHIYTSKDLGDYYRPVFAGTYNLKISSAGYPDKIINGVEVYNRTSTVVNVKMSCALSINNFEENTNGIAVSPNPFSNELKIDDLGKDFKELAIYSIEGKLIYESKNQSIINTSYWLKGVYILKLSNGNSFKYLKLIKQ